MPDRARKTASTAVAALAFAIALALLVAPSASPANPPSRFPAAGTLAQASVAVRKSPSTSARRVMTLLELRRDYRPQIVLAIGMRRVGYVPATHAQATLVNTSGQPALRVLARAEGTAGHVIRVTVQGGRLWVYVNNSLYEDFEAVDTAALANEINQRSPAITATPLAGGALADAPSYTDLRGGRNENPGRLWYKLNLPIRPFGQTGWIPADAAIVKPTTTRVVIRRGARVLDVLRNGRRVFRTRVAVGRPDRKTPLGNFYVAAKYVPPQNALVSTYALELSAPAGLPDFLRGGVVGIHGTPATYTIGRAASNGCIRVTPGVARALKRLVPLGSPVKVVR